MLYLTTDTDPTLGGNDVIPANPIERIENMPVPKKPRSVFTDDTESDRKTE